MADINMNTDNNNPVMVTIQCLVYNHEHYLRQCLDGFVMQKTNFRFEAIVHDDVSTDNSVEIIKEYAAKYPDIIKPIIETENQFSKKDGSLERIMMDNTHGKYIAFCEGDDYWTDELKLQKQIDFLENNPQFSVCTHAFYKLIDGQLVKPSDFLDENFEYKLEDSLKRWITQPLTAVFRKSSYPTIGIINNYSRFQDNHIFYYVLKKAKGFNLGEYMGVYRITGSGICTSLSTLGLLKDDIGCYRELYNHNKEDELLKSHLLDEYSVYLLYSLLKFKRPSIIPISLIGVSGYYGCFVRMVKKMAIRPIKMLKRKVE